MKCSQNISLWIGLLWIFCLGCSKDDPSGFGGNCGDGDTWFELVSDESAQLSQLSSIYSNDPSSQNCQRLKDAYADYIRALKGVSDCVLGVTREAYQQSLNSAESEIEQLCQ